jgi:hypothetical protein
VNVKYFTGRCSCTESNVHTLFREEPESDKTQKIVMYLHKVGFSCLQYHQEFFYGSNNMNLYAEVKIGAEFPENSEIVFVRSSPVSIRGFVFVLVY